MPKLEDVHKEYVKKFGEEPRLSPRRGFRGIVGSLVSLHGQLFQGQISHFPFLFSRDFRPNPILQENSVCVCS